MMQTLDLYTLLNNDQLSLTNPCNELHYSERAANKVDAQCDERATELSWQQQFSATAPAFHIGLPHLHLVPPFGVTPFEFLASENESLGYHVELFVWSYV